MQAGEPQRGTENRNERKKYPIPADSFDRCYSLLALNFMSDPGQALLRMRQATRQRGTIAAAVWDFAGNVARVLAVVVLFTTWGIDASLGWAHEALGLPPVCLSRF